MTRQRWTAGLALFWANIGFAVGSAGAAFVTSSHASLVLAFFNLGVASFVHVVLRRT